MEKINYNLIPKKVKKLAYSGALLAILASCSAPDKKTMMEYGQHKEEYEMISDDVSILKNTFGESYYQLYNFKTNKYITDKFDSVEHLGKYILGYSRDRKIKIINSKTFEVSDDFFDSVRVNGKGKIIVKIGSATYIWSNNEKYLISG